MDLCQYSTALGTPGVGFHEARLGNFALWDVVGTFVIAFMISILAATPFLKTTVVLFILSIFLHWLFCVKTYSGELLGINAANQ